MSRAGGAAGQAGRGLVRVVSALFRVAVVAVLLLAVALGALAWRLADGPLKLPFLARVIENAANAEPGPTRLAVEGVALAWDHSDTQTDRPLQLELTGLRLEDASGRTVAALPLASISVALRPLLLGRIAPRAVAISGLRLGVLRAADGSVMLDLGSLNLGSMGERTEARAADSQGASEGGGAMLARLLAALTQPEEGAFGRHQLRRLRLTDAQLTVLDRQLDQTWTVPALALDIARVPGGLDATGAASLALGDKSLRLDVAGQWRAEPFQASLTLATGSITPAALARAAPPLEALGLALLDAPLSARATLAFDAALRPARLGLAVSVGAGRIMPPGPANQPGIAITGATLQGHATAEAAVLETLRLTLPPGPDGHAPALTGQARLVRGALPRLSLTLALDRFDIARMAATWPASVGDKPRAWLVPNVTAGQVHDVALRLEATLPPNLADLEPTAIEATHLEATHLEATGRFTAATVHYLRPMPPVTGAAGSFRMDLDSITITGEGGAVGAVRARSAKVVLSSLQAHPQWADIEVALAAPVADAMALVAHPRLKLFEKRALPLNNPTGEAQARLSVRFPLLNELDMDDVAVRADANLTAVRLPGLVLGQDLTEGAFSLAVSNDAIRANGTGRLAAMPVNATYEQDFRAGPPTQVTERLRATLRMDAPGLARLGAAAEGRIGGTWPLQATLVRRRNGSGEVALSADLRGAELNLPEAGWSKPTGQAATAEASLRLTNERVTALEAIRVEAPGLSARGRLGFAQGRPERLTLTQLTLGRTRASGEVGFGADGGLSATLRGAVLDLAPYLALPSSQPAAAPARNEPPLRLDLAFERVLTGPTRGLNAVTLRLSEQNGRLASLDATGRTGAANTADAGPFRATLVPQAGARALSLEAADAGALLAALDVLETLAGGTLAVTATLDDSGTLAGTAELRDFRVRDAPAIGRLLQGMTLYGLLDVAKGPGLSFTQLTAPFSFSQAHVLTLADARAFSPSLGVTVKGRIDRRARVLDLEGTVVPAYFFNSLLGNIPIIGRLFSPERGGGVFAATYTIRGPQDDPRVAVNPLAALTPGFLRGVFGIFDAAPEGTTPAPLPPG
jgi:hypothetical protein